MLTPYRKLFATPGGLTFSIPGLIARLPIAMTYLSVTFIVLYETNSYTLAGTISIGKSTKTDPLLGLALTTELWL